MGLATMMQLDALVLYNSAGEQRVIRFKPGRLNIISGESGTGKTSIINILRFLLVSDSPYAPLGPIEQTAHWYGLHAHVGDTSFFIGRPAPEHGTTTSQAALLVGAREIPPLSALQATVTIADIVDYLGGLIGIGDNLNVPPDGQTRRPLSANLRHALYYCFQGQGEIANPDILFHHQNRDFQKQAIRDTLPYFLGAQDVDALSKREELSAIRREVRRLSSRITTAETERDAGAGQAAVLIEQARAAGLITTQDTPASADDARAILTGLLTADSTPEFSDTADQVGLEQLLERRRTLRNGIRALNSTIHELDVFAGVDTSYDQELNEHRARLASIGLIDESNTQSASCPVCARPIEYDTKHQALTRSLGRVQHRLELAARERPRIQGARSEAVQDRARTRVELNQIEQAIEALTQAVELQQTARGRWEQQSFVRGRIAQFLDSAAALGDDELEPEAVRSAVSSLLAVVGLRMTNLAQTLGLEHSENFVRIDPYRLTVVADTLKGPAYMDAGEIGSGMSWVGYHLVSYLALQDYFIEAERPVPRFVVIDQPSQAFFPRDRERGGDLDELSDTDRENTRKLYRLMYDQVAAQEGELQVIAFDHAAFAEDWFSESIIETWRDGNALIPQSWIDDAADQN
jgi:CRP-like cAMP-binding protein